jgi:MoaA/NifB/PqqE/SkfB family radical SAM enzyme
MNLNPHLPKNGLVIHWDMWYGCNLNCPYCFYNESRKDLQKKEAKVNATDWVNGFVKLNRPLFIAIDGGEPFLKKDFINLISQLQKFAILGIATSLTKDLTEFIEVVNFSRIARMLLSFHPTLSQPINIFIERVNQLKLAGLKTYVINCVAYPEFLTDIPKYYLTFKEAGLKMHVTRFVGTYKGKNYPQEYSSKELNILSQFMLNPINEIQISKNNEPNGRLCGAGNKFIYVGADGNVSRCCHNTNKIIGNILEGNFLLEKQCSPCYAEACYAFQAIERGITPFLSLEDAKSNTKLFYSSL